MRPTILDDPAGTADAMLGFHELLRVYHPTGMCTAHSECFAALA